MSVVYLVVGLVAGLGIGISKSFWLASVHTHILMLGWAAPSVIGIIYMLIPEYGETRLASIHFWGHNLGLPVMMAGLVLEASGRKEGEPLLVAGSLAVLLSLFAFAVNLLRAGRVLAGEQSA
ncbi:MAG: cytochrome-c oxidase [Bryobacteraceae bacterium]|nr:cytochrome-c oxidase [Bryobacteraceae bacterium]